MNYFIIPRKVIKNKHSVVVFGSGPIAISAALLLSKNGIDVAIIIDENKLKNRKGGPARLFALAYNSCEILKDFIDFNSSSQAINHIRVVDNNSRAKVDFLPIDIGLDTFGYMIDEADLIDLLYSSLLKSNVKIYELNGGFDISQGEFFATITFNDQSIYSPLIIAADGKYSTIRQYLSMETEEYDYNQTAIVIDIRHSSWPHQGVAVEKFTPNGPFAILPKYNENCTTSSLVWVEEGKLDHIPFSEKIMRDLIMVKLDQYLGDIELISEPIIYHLKLIKSLKRFCGRVVFVGDAAQAIHPIAGQGFNLGLRDIIEVVKLICDSADIGIDYGTCLEKYSMSRDTDVSKMILSTSLLNSLFANDIFPLKILRRLGLKIFDKIPLFKKTTMKYACGL